MLRIDIITLFPDFFTVPFASSIIGRAVKNNLVELNAVNLRNYTEDNYQKVDDKPYGGGPGQLMMPGPLFKAINDLKGENSKVIYLSPAGQPFKQKKATSLAKEEHLIFICGHYEGVDERVIEALVDMEISLGDFVLSSGNPAALAVADAIIRLLPGALGCDKSIEEESFNSGLLEYPQYTRPENFNNMAVPKVLLSGNHKKIEQWRAEQSLERTRERRPELLSDLQNGDIK